ncbi:MAG: hypothetical protein FWD87_10440 [Spirochaetaceae bacterium]|nr:hypothetical protein [Spirochaetaceae bacterium]
MKVEFAWEDLEKSVQDGQKDVIRFFLEKENENFKLAFEELFKESARQDAVQECIEKISKDFLKILPNCCLSDNNKRFIWDFSNVIFHKQDNIYLAYYYYGRKNYTWLRLGLELLFENLSEKRKKFLEEEFNKCFEENWQRIFNKEAWIIPPQEKYFDIYNKFKNSNINKSSIDLITCGKEVINSLLVENIKLQKEMGAILNKNEKRYIYLSDLLSEYYDIVAVALESESSGKKEKLRDYTPSEFEVLLKKIYGQLLSIRKNTKYVCPEVGKVNDQIKYAEKMLITLIKGLEKSEVTDAEITLLKNLEKDPESKSKAKRSITNVGKEEAMQNYIVICSNEKIKKKMNAYFKKMSNYRLRVPEKVLENKNINYLTGNLSDLLERYFDKENEAKWLELLKTYFEKQAEKLTLEAISSGFMEINKSDLKKLFNYYCDMSEINNPSEEIEKHFEIKIKYLCQELRPKVWRHFYNKRRYKYGSNNKIYR